MDPFAPPVENWQPIDPAWLRMKRLTVLLVWPLLVLATAAIVGWLWPWWAGAAVLALGVPLVAYRWWRLVRVHRMWGYAEHETDLYLREGLWVRRLTVVPYGRMQVVSVNSGPLQRRYGLATVTLETASSGTDASIPGLPVARADALRDRLTALGEQQAIGL